MADQYRRPYVDSSVFLGWKNREVINGIDRHAVFQHIWQLAETNQFRIYTSAFTFAEIYKLRHQSTIQPLTTINDLLKDFERDFVESVEVDREIGLEANFLCRTYAANKLFPNDAIHLACALRAKCDVLLAWGQAAKLYCPSPHKNRRAADHRPNDATTDSTCWREKSMNTEVHQR